MKKVYEKKIDKIIVFFLFLPVLLFSSCENFLSGSLLKEELTESIEYANSPSYTITVQAVEGTGTVTSLATVEKKVKDVFPVSFSPAEGYKFLGWKTVRKTEPNKSLDGYIKFTNPNSPETSAEFIQGDNELRIIPACEQVFKVSSYYPKSDMAYCRDSAILIDFNKPIATSIVSGSSKDILNKIKISVSGLSNSSEYFGTPEVINGNTIRIFTKYDNLIPVDANANKSVYVTVPKELFYESAHGNGNITLEQDFSFSYVISSETSEKTSVSFLAADAYDDAGNIKIDNVTNTGSSRKFSIGETSTITYKNNADYYFRGWDAYILENGIKTPVTNEISFSAVYESDSEFDIDEVTKITTSIMTVNKSISGEIFVKPRTEKIPEVKIKINARNGTITPSIGTYTMKEGDVFDLIFAASADYCFTNWKAYTNHNDDAIIFKNIILTSTSDGDAVKSDNVLVKIGELSAENLDDLDFCITIEPVWINRPEVLSWGPTDVSNGSYRDAKIQAMFDRAINPLSIYYTDSEIKEINDTIGNVTYLPNNDAENKYGYKTANGEIFYKNITITNNENGRNLLEYYGAPFFSNSTTLVIPAKPTTVVNGAVTEINAPPPGVFIRVELDSAFYCTENQTDIVMTRPKKWNYLTNDDIDYTAPILNDSDYKIYKSRDDITVIPAPMGGINLDFIKTIPALKDSSLLPVYLAISDPASGPAATFDFIFTKYYDSSDYNRELSEAEKTATNISYGFSGNGKLGSSTTPALVSMQDLLATKGLSEGVYKVDVEVSDNNLNKRKTDKPYYVVYDVTGPETEAPTYSTDVDTGDNSKASITVHWINPTVSDYSYPMIAYRVKDSGSVFAQKKLSPSDTEYTINGLEFGTSYEIKVRFYDIFGNNQEYTPGTSSALNFVNTLPKPITSFDSITGWQSDTSVTLKWNKPEGNYTGTRIEYSQDSNFETDVKTITNKDLSNSISQTVSNLEYGCKYYFRAYSIGTEDAISKDSVSATANSFGSIVVSPKKLTFGGQAVVGRNSLSLRISEPTTKYDGIKVYYSDNVENLLALTDSTADEDFDGTIITSPKDSLTHTTSTNFNYIIKAISGLQTGTSYYFKAKAYVMYDDIEYCSELNGDAKLQYTSPTPVTNLEVVESTTSTAKIKWEVSDDRASSLQAGYKFVRDSDTSANWVNVTINKESTEYSFENLIPGEKYNFRVTRTHGYTSSSTITYNMSPDKVKDLKLTGKSATSVQLDWVNPAGVYSAVKIYRGTDADDVSTLVTSITNKATTYTDTNLVQGTSYFYKLETCTEGGLTASTDVEGLATSAGAVSGLTYNSRNTTSVTLKWTNPSGAYAGINIYYKVWDAQSYTKLPQITNKANTYNVTGLTAGTRYTFKLVVYTIENGVEKESTEAAPTYSVATMPYAVTGVTVSERTKTSIKVSWSAPSKENYSGYTIKWGETTSSMQTATTTTSDRNYTINNLKPGTYYYVYVYSHAVNDDVTTLSSANSGGSTYTYPDLVTNVTANGAADGKVTVSWNVPASGSYSYAYVMYKLSTSSTWSVFSEQVNWGTNTVTVTGLNKGYNYDFKVRTVSNSSIYSTPADTAKVSAYTLPDPVKSLSVTSSSTSSITASWSNPTVGNYDGIILNYKLSSSSTWSTNITLAKGTTSREITGLLVGAKYDVKVTTYVNSTSNKSAEVTGNANVKPNMVSNFTVTMGATSATLSWTKPSGTYDKYTVMYRKSTDGSYKEINVSTSTSYTFNNLEGGATLYDFYVRTYSGTSYNFNTYVRKPTLPNAPTNVFISRALDYKRATPSQKTFSDTSKDGNIFISYTKPEGNISGYRVYYGNSYSNLLAVTSDSSYYHSSSTAANYTSGYMDLKAFDEGLDLGTYFNSGAWYFKIRSYYTYNSVTYECEVDTNPSLANSLYLYTAAFTDTKNFTTQNDTSDSSRKIYTFYFKTPKVWLTGNSTAKGHMSLFFENTHLYTWEDLSPDTTYTKSIYLSSSYSSKYIKVVPVKGGTLGDIKGLYTAE